jgi:hypothetical protein
MRIMESGHSSPSSCWHTMPSACVVEARYSCASPKRDIMRCHMDVGSPPASLIWAIMFCIIPAMV